MDIYVMWKLAAFFQHWELFEKSVSWKLAQFTVQTENKNDITSPYLGWLPNWIAGVFRSPATKNLSLSIFHIGDFFSFLQ